MGHVEHVGDVSLLGAFLGEFHDLLAAFLTGHADGVNVTEFAVCAARPAFRGSDTGLASDTVNSRVTDTEQSGDATVGDFTWGEACDQVGTLLAGYTDLLGGEVVRAILDPTFMPSGYPSATQIWPSKAFSTACTKSYWASAACRILTLMSSVA